MEYESSVKNILSDSLERIRTIIDANTVVGNPIHTPSGTVIIPISKVSMGFASGGLDLPAKSEEGRKSFGGGGGTGVTVLPIGFLTVYPDGKAEMLPLNPEKSGPIEQVADILEQAPDIIARIKSVFTGDAEDTDADAPDEEEIRRMEEDCAKKLADEPAPTLTKQELKAIKKAAAKEAKRSKS